MKIVILLFLSGVFGLTIEAQPNRKLAIIGSSTSACTGPSTYDSCYVGRLVKYYSSVGSPITVYNIAIGGTNPYQAMPTGYIPPLNRPSTNTNANITNAINNNPGAILVNFPSNNYCEYTVAEVLNCFRIIKQAANAANIPCYITTTQPREEGCFLNDSVQLKFTRIKDSVLQQFGSYSIDFYTTLADPNDSTIFDAYNSGDGIHLNNAGHRILFERVRDKNIFDPVILPLRFVHFTGTIRNEKNLLEWTTAGEADLKKFEVQKSTDGVHYTNIKSVPATNTASQHTYLFTDESGRAMTAFYQIKAIDKDARTTLSTVVKLTWQNRPFKIVSTSSTSGSIWVQVDASTNETINLQLLSSTGQVITVEEKLFLPGTSILRFNQIVSAGFYFLKITDGDSNTEVKKIFVSP